MKQLVSVLATVLVAALTYTAVTLLTSKSPSEPGLLPILAGVLVGGIVGRTFFQRRPKA